MKIRGVTVLDEAVEDMEAGREFYDAREYGIGDYFTDCLLSDIESLKIYAGIHNKCFSYCRMLSKKMKEMIRFLIINIMEIQKGFLFHIT